MLIHLPAYHLTTFFAGKTQPGGLFSSVTFVRWLKYIQLNERQRENIFFCHKKRSSLHILCQMHKVISLCQQTFSVPVIQQQKKKTNQSHFSPRKANISKPLFFSVHGNEVAKFTVLNAVGLLHWPLRQCLFTLEGCFLLLVKAS